jgi:BirA family biotin operon repressor/biotin-[acetyl-CoA-carboxylase] ligase
MHLPDPVFPPMLTGHAVKAPQRPFDLACWQAQRGGMGAGDLVWSRNTGRAECAIVLEPEVPLRTALQMHALTELALADCLGALLPPRIAVHHRWPGVVLINGAAAGEVRLGVPDTSMSEIPGWLVVGMRLRLVHDAPGREPGELPGQTSLAEEGAGELDRTRLLQSFAAHFLTWLNTWQDDGFRPIHEGWMHRAEGAGDEGGSEIEIDGMRQAVRVLGLDEEGGLVCRADQGPVRVLSLSDCIVRWQAEGARS